ncbi:CLUMA_CG003135, isoform A [Clunio marinus]|uniref:Carboxylic ester hydrolase n=1 Tax=Clunio marinus TaxID=568069 RepID=A0A1J1HMV2_9DIPT|nr:CLUMA_CG003135, isoform A [Clunio marinus]
MRMMIKIFILFALLCGFCLARTSKDLKVRIDDGRIIGRYLTTENGKTIRAFMGIPYAEPPIKNLRFKAPVKVKPWQGILLAQQEPPMCMQANVFIRERKIEGQEDCLYLNVYAPPKRNKTEGKVPVLVWIHGGGWINGHGGHSLYPPGYFLEHDVVLVTGNYRLGPLGFLSFESEECPGNFGMKDQVMLLKWVRMNIDKFGGDSNSVTIFGESAGGASVNYHMISPMSKGLFDKAISQSGALMNIWADPPRPGLAKMRGIRLSDKVGCPISNTNFKLIVECLRKVDGKKITEAMFEFYEWDNDPVVPFPPVVERISEEEGFISDYRFNKHSFDIPWITGITSDEGLFKTSAFFNNKKLMDDMKKNWDRLLPITFYYDHFYADEQRKISEELNEFYFNNEPFFESNRENLTNLWSDGLLIGFVENLKYRLHNNLRDNTFVYQFSHKGSISYTEILQGGAENFYGTSHGDLLLYLFPCHKTIPAFFSAIPETDDKEVARLMTKLWVNFAETGNPTPEWSTASEFPLWSPVRKFPLDYLSIGNKNGNSEKLLSMERGLWDERAEFWQKIRRENPKFNIWDIDENIKDEF